MVLQNPVARRGDSLILAGHCSTGSGQEHGPARDGREDSTMKFCTFLIREICAFSVSFWTILVLNNGHISIEEHTRLYDKLYIHHICTSLSALIIKQTHTHTWMYLFVSTCAWIYLSNSCRVGVDARRLWILTSGTCNIQRIFVRLSWQNETDMLLAAVLLVDCMVHDLWFSGVFPELLGLSVPLFLGAS